MGRFIALFISVCFLCALALQAPVHALTDANTLQKELHQFGYALNAGRGEEVLRDIFGGYAEANVSTALELAIQEAFPRPSIVTEWTDESDTDVRGPSLLDTLRNRYTSTSRGLLLSLMRESGRSLLRGERVDADISAQASAALGMATADEVFDALKRAPLLADATLETDLTFTGHGTPQWSLTAVKPVYESDDFRHNAFTQLGWTRTNTTTTYNLGAAYRHLTADHQWALGPNAFFDYRAQQDHTRLSIGFDAMTSEFGVSANRYFRLKDWKDSRFGFEERALSGYDIELSGRVPGQRNVELFARQFFWWQNGVSNIRGQEYRVEYTPIPLVRLHAALIDDNVDQRTVEAGAHLRYQFGVPWSVQTRTYEPDPSSALDRRFAKVRRENIIRTQERLKAEVLGTVTQTVGANTLTANSTTSSLFIGQTLPLPVTLAVENVPGAIAVVRFGDGAVLTLAQATTIDLTLGLITLRSGSMAFTSGGTTRLINVPGGSITLLGTDIDITSNAIDSYVRVREGAIRADTAGGALIGSTGNLIHLTAGVPVSIPPGDAAYDTHADTISSRIDLVADPRTQLKAAAYIPDTPQLSAPTLALGAAVTIIVPFTKALAVSGGTPELVLAVNGVERRAPLTAGAGSSALTFTYTLQAADGGASTITVRGIDPQGAAVTNAGQPALLTLADATLSLGGTLVAGGTVSWISDPIVSANSTAASFQFANADPGDTFTYTITSSGGGGSVNGSGTLITGTDTIGAIDVSALPDGTLTLSVIITDAVGPNPAVSDTVLKDTTAPAGYAVNWLTDPVNAANASAASIQISAAEVGADYSFTIVSSGGGAPVTGSGTASGATVTRGGLDLSGLGDGTLTAYATLTDTLGNVGGVVTDTAVKSTGAVTVVVATTSTDPTNTAPVPVSFTFSVPVGGLAIGDLLVTNATASSLTTADSITYTAQLTPTADGVVSVQVPAGAAQDGASNPNIASNIVSVTYDSTAPSGYAVSWLTNPVGASAQTSASFQITAAEAGADYSFTIVSSGGGAPVLGSGTASGPIVTRGGLDLSGLSDGTLTVYLSLTDALGNAGTIVTDTAIKSTGSVTVIAATAAANPTNTAPIPVTLTFSVPVTGLSLADLVLTNASAFSLTTTDNTVYTIQISPTTDGLVSVQVPAAAAQDGATNDNAASNVLNFTYDSVAPSGYAIAWVTDPVNATSAASASIQISVAEIGADYSFTIVSDGGGTPVTGTGTVAASTVTLGGIDVSGLSDGTLSAFVSLTDIATNAGLAISDTADKDTVAPMITGVTPPPNGTYTP